MKIFQDVKTAEEIDVAKGNGSMNYTQYVGVVQKVANLEDEKSKHSNMSRKVKTHSIEYN